VTLLAPCTGESHQVNHMASTTPYTRVHETWPDIAKGIGIVLVVYGHVARGVEKAGLRIEKPFFEMVDALIYAFHMPLFFFVSGYLFWGSVNSRGVRSVLPVRLGLLLWLYLIWSVGHGSIEVLLAHLTNGGLRWTEVFSLWLPRAHFWYLYTLALLILVASAFGWIPERYRAMALFAVGTVFFAMPGLGTSVYPLLAVGWFLVYFAAGFLLAAHRFRSQKSRHALITYIYWLALGMGMVALMAPNLLSKLAAAFTGIALVCAIAVALTQYSRKLSRWFAFLGSIALPIYLAHILAGSGTRILLQKFLGVDVVWVHLMLGLISGLLLPWTLWTVTTKLGQGWLWALPWVGPNRQRQGALRSRA